MLTSLVSSLRNQLQDLLDAKWRGCKTSKKELQNIPRVLKGPKSGPEILPLHPNHPDQPRPPDPNGWVVVGRWPRNVLAHGDARSLRKALGRSSVMFSKSQKHSKIQLAQTAKSEDWFSLIFLAGRTGEETDFYLCRGFPKPWTPFATRHRSRLPQLLSQGRPFGAANPEV